MKDDICFLLAVAAVLSIIVGSFAGCAITTALVIVMTGLSPELVFCFTIPFSALGGGYVAHLVVSTLDRMADDVRSQPATAKADDPSALDAEALLAQWKA